MTSTKHTEPLIIDISTPRAEPLQADLEKTPTERRLAGEKSDFELYCEQHPLATPTTGDMKNTFPNNSDKKWKRNFIELFVDTDISTEAAPNGWWQTDLDYPLDATPENVMNFIEKLLKSQITLATRRAYEKCLEGKDKVNLYNFEDDRVHAVSVDFIKALLSEEK